MGLVQTGGVPNLQMTFGGSILGFGGIFGSNFLGVLIAVGMPFVFVALWTGVLLYLFGIADAMPWADVGGVGNLSGVGAAMAGQMGAKAWYLLCSGFPIALFFTLLQTELVLKLTMAKGMLLVTAGSRFLWGR